MDDFSSKSEVLRLLAPRDFYEKHGRPFHPDFRVTPEEIKAREAFVAREADDARKAAAIAPRKRSAKKPSAADPGIITVHIGDKAFDIPESVLTKDSKHFAELIHGTAMTGPRASSSSSKGKSATQQQQQQHKTTTIEMHDVGPSAFQLYVVVIHGLAGTDGDGGTEPCGDAYELPRRRAGACPDNNTRRAGSKYVSKVATHPATARIRPGGRWRAEQLLRLWQLGLRFRAPRVCRVADRALAHLFSRFDAAGWRGARESDRFSLRGYRMLFAEMAVAWRLCRAGERGVPLPYAHRCVAALAAAPSGVFAGCVEALDGEPDFQVEVAEAFSKRLAEARKKGKKGSKKEGWAPLPGRK